MTPLLSIDSYWWLYVAFTAFVIALLSCDLILHRRNSQISIPRAAVFTALWIAVALAFSAVVYRIGLSVAGAAAGRDLALQFITGYVIEESLSVDNMFVFALVFRYFAVPARYEHKVLFYGVLGAMVLRAAFVITGSLLIRFQWVLVGFGVLLVYSGIRLAIGAEENLRPGDSWVISVLRKWLPVTVEFQDGHFLTRIGGRLHATPMLVVLLVLESTDLMFAVDSVPAVLGVTREPFVAFSSNILAVVGLRSMYFVLAGALERFHVLKHGLAVVLVFVGLKMVWLDRLFGGTFPIGASLAIIAAVIGGSVALSLISAKWKSEWTILARGAFGIALLVFAALAVVGTFGRDAEGAPWLDVSIRAEALYLSAACYAFCGVLVLCSLAGRRQ